MPQLGNLLSQTSTLSQGPLRKGLSLYCLINQSFRRSKLPIVLTDSSKFDPKYSFSSFQFRSKINSLLQFKGYFLLWFTRTNIWYIRRTPDQMETLPYSIKAVSLSILICEKIHRITSKHYFNIAKIVEVHEYSYRNKLQEKILGE